MENNWQAISRSLGRFIFLLFKILHCLLLHFCTPVQNRSKIKFNGVKLEYFQAVSGWIVMLIYADTAFAYTKDITHRVIRCTATRIQTRKRVQGRYACLICTNTGEGIDPFELPSVLSAPPRNFRNNLSWTSADRSGGGYGRATGGAIVQ